MTRRKRPVSALTPRPASETDTHLPRQGILDQHIDSVGVASTVFGRTTVTGNEPIEARAAELLDLIENGRPAWQQRAACRGRGLGCVNLWFSDDTLDQAVARHVCAGCPVRAECGQMGRRQHERGIWGGTEMSDSHQIEDRILDYVERHPFEVPLSHLRSAVKGETGAIDRVAKQMLASGRISIRSIIVPVDNGRFVYNRERKLVGPGEAA